MMLKEIRSAHPGSHSLETSNPCHRTSLFARAIYLARHANSKYWVDFEDFSFYRLEVVDVYYVGGFGVMGWVAASDYTSAVQIRWRTRWPESSSI